MIWEEQVDGLDLSDCSYPEGRPMTHLELATKYPQWNIGHEAIRNALTLRGCSLCKAPNKPPFSDANWNLRLERDRQYADFSLSDLFQIIRSDKTNIGDGLFNMIYTTKKDRYI